MFSFFSNQVTSGPIGLDEWISSMMIQKRKRDFSSQEQHTVVLKWVYQEQQLTTTPPLLWLIVCPSDELATLEGQRSIKKKWPLIRVGGVEWVAVISSENLSSSPPSWSVVAINCKQWRYQEYYVDIKSIECPSSEFIVSPQAFFSALMTPTVIGPGTRQCLDQQTLFLFNTRAFDSVKAHPGLEMMKTLWPVGKHQSKNRVEESLVWLEQNNWSELWLTDSQSQEIRSIEKMRRHHYDIVSGCHKLDFDLWQRFLNVVLSLPIIFCPKSLSKTLSACQLDLESLLTKSLNHTINQSLSTYEARKPSLDFDQRAREIRFAFYPFQIMCRLLAYHNDALLEKRLMRKYERYTQTYVKKMDEIFFSNTFRNTLMMFPMLRDTIERHKDLYFPKKQTAISKCFTSLVNSPRVELMLNKPYFVHNEFTELHICVKAQFLPTEIIYQEETIDQKQFFSIPNTAFSLHGPMELIRYADKPKDLITITDHSESSECLLYIVLTIPGLTRVVGVCGVQFNDNTKLFEAHISGDDQIQVSLLKNTTLSEETEKEHGETDDPSTKLFGLNEEPGKEPGKEPEKEPEKESVKEPPNGWWFLW
jgi:hypothetical protein